MKERSETFGSNGYRFAFNGKEQDPEVSGSGNTIAFEARIYDSRLGRFLSTDPWEKKYAWQTTYAYFKNSPIKTLDFLGKGAKGKGRGRNRRRGANNGFRRMSPGERVTTYRMIEEINADIARHNFLNGSQGLPEPNLPRRSPVGPIQNNPLGEGGGQVSLGNNGISTAIVDLALDINDEIDKYRIPLSELEYIVVTHIDRPGRVSGSYAVFIDPLSKHGKKFYARQKKWENRLQSALDKIKPLMAHPENGTPEEYRNWRDDFNRYTMDVALTTIAYYAYEGISPKEGLNEAYKQKIRENPLKFRTLSEETTYDEQVLPGPKTAY